MSRRGFRRTNTCFGCRATGTSCRGGRYTRAVTYAATALLCRLRQNKFPCPTFRLFCRPAKKSAGNSFVRWLSLGVRMGLFVRLGLRVSQGVARLTRPRLPRLTHVEVAVLNSLPRPPAPKLFAVTAVVAGSGKPEQVRIGATARCRQKVWPSPARRAPKPA